MDPLGLPLPAPARLPRLLRENRFAIVDIETTGLSRQRAEIIQVAVAQVDHGQPRLRATTYVQPTSDYVEPGAVAKHGINSYVLDHASLFEDVAGDLLQLIGDRCLLGYNIHSFDFPILERHFARAGHPFNPNILDVLTWERKLSAVKGRHSLAAALERWQVTTLAVAGPATQHNALDDVRLTWNLFLRMAAERSELGDLPLEDALVRKTVPRDTSLDLL